MRKPTWLLDYTSNTFSQIGEDGVIGKVLSMLPKRDKWCVEFGAWDGVYLSNTRNLVLSNGYRSVLIEAHPERFKQLEANLLPGTVALQKYVGFTADTGLDSILAPLDIPKDFDFLSIDIDGNDYHVWEAIQRYRPKVVCVEFNQTIPTEVDWVQPKDPKIQWGCSLRALERLGKLKGYKLVSVLHWDAIFVDEQYFKLFEIEDNSPTTLRTNLTNITWVWRGYDGSAHWWGGIIDPWSQTSLDIRVKENVHL